MSPSSLMIMSCGVTLSIVSRPAGTLDRDARSVFASARSAIWRVRVRRRARAADGGGWPGRLAAWLDRLPLRAVLAAMAVLFAAVLAIPFML